MALIENLEGDGWEEFLGESFRYALYVLKHDRFRSVFSGARAAGVPHTPWRLPGCVRRPSVGSPAGSAAGDLVQQLQRRR